MYQSQIKDTTVSSKFPPIVHAHTLCVDAKNFKKPTIKKEEKPKLKKLEPKNSGSLV